MKRVQLTILFEGIPEVESAKATAERLMPGWRAWTDRVHVLHNDDILIHDGIGEVKAISVGPVESEFTFEMNR